MTLRWTIRVTPGLATRIAELPPERKRRIRDTLRHLETSPHRGKALQRELSGCRSVTVKPLRIIYHLAERTVHLDAIGWIATTVSARSSRSRAWTSSTVSRSFS